MSLEIVEGLDRVDFERVHRWLTNSYWSPGISLEKVRRAAAGTSLVVSAFADGEQVGYMRVISDKATFAWIADVYVDESQRGKGIAKAMLQFALAHPEHQGLRRWVLATRDAHRVYESAGFGPLWEPHRWMIHFPAGEPTPAA
ncbi:MAG: GNAT family N-acetyltransferase [Fimbriimonas sp.]